VSRGVPKTDRVATSSDVAVSRIKELELHHVFGYRGFDCRNNVHYLDECQQIVFHAAGSVFYFIFVNCH